MTLRLSPAMLARAYDLIRATAPFDGWHLPDSDAIVFRVVRSKVKCGFYRRDEYGRHSISISVHGVGYLSTLCAIMAHEMIHLHLAITKREGRAEHGAAFQQLAARACRVHGFDPKLF